MLITGSGGERLLCEKLENQTLRLHRVFAGTDTVDLPQEIDGMRITVIGAYCFAQRGRLSKELQEEAVQAGLGDGTNPAAGALRPLNGEYLRELRLPDSVRCLETYAFYNCRRLSRLTVGAGLTEVHSDAFMNCRSLHTLAVHGSADAPSGLQFLLNQLTAELMVSFETEDGPPVRLLYPEYSESYEEIGPAHIFSLHVEGEGYRARKQFTDGRVDFGGYDGVFEKASNEEQFLTLMKMALNRLEYPQDLSEQARARYERYITEHEREVLVQLVEQQDEETLQLLCGQQLISDEAIQEAVIRAVDTGWLRGAAGIIRWRNADAH